MYTVLLIEKLQEIERALDLDDCTVIRKMLAEAQQYAVLLQRESPEQMRRDSRAVIHHHEIA